MLIKNGEIVTSSGLIKQDIFISNGKISKVSDSIEEQDNEIIDATGMIIMPGAIDSHVHARDMALAHKEDFYTASCAAAAGGVTTILEMPNSNPPTINAENFKLKREAAKKSIVNYGFHFGSTTQNIEEIRNAKNIASVKIYMGSSTGNMLVEGDNYLSALLDAVDVVCVHAEDEDTIRKNTEILIEKNTPEIHPEIRTNEAAQKAVDRIEKLHEHKKSKLYICHSSTKEEMQLIEQAKQKGENIFVEVCPHHLIFTKEDMKEKGNFLKMNPPLRSKEDVEYLWKAISNGTVDVIATDHAPHTKEEKMKDYKDAPAGVPGVENMLPILLDAVNKSKLTLQRVVELVVKNPINIFNISNKGKLEEGYDADITIIDMKKQKTIKDEEQFTKCKWSPYSGMVLQGWPVYTIVNGNIVFQEGKIFDDKKGEEIIIAK